MGTEMVTTTESGNITQDTGSSEKVDQDYLQQFQKWMLEKGRMDSNGFPAEGLSPRTARNRSVKVRRVLVDLKFISAKKKGYKKFDYSYSGDLGTIGPEDFESWFSRTFPVLRNNKDRQRKSDFVDASYKFGQFLHFQMKVWTQEDLELLMRSVRRPRVEQIYGATVDIPDLAKTDAFIGYLKKISPVHYMMLYLMRFAGLRYIEVINITADLASGTMVANFKEDRIVVFGKGRGGLSQKRTVPFFKDNQKELEWYLRWRTKEKITSKWLFVNQYRRKWSENSGHFNSWLRVQGKTYGFSEDELKLLTTHRLGRHSYATACTKMNLQERFIVDNMGLRNAKILLRFQNLGEDERVEATRVVLGLQGGKKAAEVRDNDETDNGRRKTLTRMLADGDIDQETYRLAMRQLTY